MAPPAHFDIYEVCILHGHIVTSEEASANAITIPDIEAHAFVIADAKYARAYGELSATEHMEAFTNIIEEAPKYATHNDIAHAYESMCRPIFQITDVTYDAPDTTVNFVRLTDGERIDLFIPVTSAPPLSDVQFGISHDMNAYFVERNFVYGSGSIFVQSPRGNDDLKKFLTTINNKGDDGVWNKTWLLDVICPELPRHDVFFEVQIIEYGQTPRGQTTIKFFFVLP